MTRAWLRACVGAEAVGMTAAASAARLAAWVGDRGVPVGWSLVAMVAGGLVEGAALGVLQSRVLRPRLGDALAHRWTVATVAVAGVAWGLGAAPSTLGAGDGAAPPLALVLLGGAAVGTVTGGLLGLAQAVCIRRDRRASLRWAAASAGGWTATMPVIYLGASIPDADWPTLAVVPLGTATGLVAGAVLGVLTARAAGDLPEGPAARGPKVPPDGEVRPWEQVSARS